MAPSANALIACSEQSDTMIPKGRVSVAIVRMTSNPDISGNSTSRSKISGLSVPAASMAALPQPTSSTTCRSSLRSHSPIRRSCARAWSSTINIFRCASDVAIALPLPGAHCGGKVGFLAEVAFDGRHLVIPKLKIFDVPERLSVGGVTDVHHKCLVVRPHHLLQVKPVNISILCVPASCLES